MDINILNVIPDIFMLHAKHIEITQDSIVTYFIIYMKLD